MVHDLLGYEIFTQTQFDEFRDLTLRQLNGGGLRLEKTFNSQNTLQVALGAGIMSDHEQLSYETTTNARATSYFSLVKNFTKDDSSFISVVTYYQPLLFDHGDYRINSEVNLRTSIVNKNEYKLGLDTSVVYLYDTVPSEKVKNTDISIKSGLVLSW